MKPLVEVVVADAGPLIGLSRGLVAEVAPPLDWALDAGKASAIATARDLGTGLLIDDRAARRVAVARGVPVIGLLGVLVLAERGGEIPQIRPLTGRSVASGYYLAERVIEDALRLTGE